MAEPVVAAGTTARTFHKVKRGETISEIADEYGVSQRELLSWNGLDERGLIRAGQRIRVVSPDRTGERTHIVRRGETLKGLARRYGVSVQALRTANGIGEGETLRAGVALKIPG
jgi:membrane-bound lytic murein transglycosylase D